MTPAEAPRVSENDLLRGVLDLAAILGWKTLHIRPGRTSHGWRTPIQGDGAGFPDILAVRGSRIVVAELKVARGTVTPAQLGWLDAFRQAGVDAYIVRRHSG